MQENDEDNYDAFEEQIFTSPLRLLLAIDGQLSQKHSQAAGEPLLPGTADVPTCEERTQRLQHLRDDVQQYWDCETDKLQ